MIIEADPTAGEFRKRAETRDERDRLRQEAEVLAVARHPGVVELLALDGDTLRLRLVEGRPLSALREPAADQRRQIGLAVATTLADLHDIGVAHRAVRADHLIIDVTGRPVVCGFGRASLRRGPVAPDDALVDVVGLAATLPVDPVPRVAARVRRRSHPARRLATVLAAPHRPPRSRFVTAGILIAVAAAVTVTAMGAITFALARARPGPESRAPTSRTLSPLSTAVSPCPPVDLGCHPLAGGVTISIPGGRYRIGQPGDLVIFGRWHCRAALPALLRPGTGEIWIWDQWASTGGAATGRRLTDVVGAVSLEVDPGLGACDLIRVTRDTGPPVAVRPDQPA